MIIKQLPRKFKIGATILDDPMPLGDLSQVQSVLAQQFPMLRHTHIYEADGVLSDCATFILYAVILPPVKVQG